MEAFFGLPEAVCIYLIEVETWGEVVEADDQPSSLGEKE